MISICFHLLTPTANARESDKRDLKSELEVMKTLKPHPHVIKLLGCVTESGNEHLFEKVIPSTQRLSLLCFQGLRLLSLKADKAVNAVIVENHPSLKM